MNERKKTVSFIKVAGEDIIDRHERNYRMSFLFSHFPDYLFYILLNKDIIPSGPNFIILDLPSLLILIIADQILNDSLCCSNRIHLTFVHMQR